MRDFRVKMTVRNARLLDAIEDAFGTQAEMARQTGVNQQVINSLVAMRQTPLLASGEWREAAVDIATALGKHPSELWPDHLAEMRVKRSAEVRLDVADVQRITSGAETVEQRDLLQRMAVNLTPREIKVITMQTSGATLDEIGAEIGGTSRERVRQIAAKAYRKMRTVAAQRLGIDSLKGVIE